MLTKSKLEEIEHNLGRGHGITDKEVIELVNAVEKMREALLNVVCDLNVALEDGINKPLTVEPVLYARKKSMLCLKQLFGDDRT